MLQCFGSAMNVTKILFSSNKIYSFSCQNYSTILKTIATMQRPIDVHIKEAQKQRKIIKERSTKYSPSLVTLQVLGAGTKGCPKSVFVFTDQSRYLFNCGEGTQRLAHEHKMKLARLEHIFFTSASWSNLGGLPGVALTLQDTGVPNIVLHGPSGLDELFKATRKFIVLKDMKIEMADCNSNSFYDDPVMSVKYVPLYKKTTALESSCIDEQYLDIEPDNTDYYAHESSGRRSLQNENISTPKDFTQEQLCSMAYICRLKPSLGRLDLQKCVEKGVKPGPNLGLLKNGQDVILPDGTTVFAKDVRTPDDPGPVFMVIEVPQLEYLESLVTNKEFAKYQKHENMDDCPSVIIHFTQENIIQNQQYQNFMKSFSCQTMQLIINDKNDCPGSIAITRVQNKLNLLDNRIFPLLKTVVPPAEQTDEEMAHLVWEKINGMNDKQLANDIKIRLNSNETTNIVSNEESNVLYAKTFTAFNLRPKKGIDRSSELKCNVMEHIGETLLYPNFTECLQKIYSIKSKVRTSTSDYPRVVFFGTGSCIPNKTRNTSCIMIHLDDSNSIILDCGEGSFGQIVRYYGKEGIVNIMRNLKAIYLSHLHADHHLGLIGIIQGRRDIFKSNNIENDKPLLLLAPKQIMNWLWFYHYRFENILQEIQLIPNSSLYPSNVDYKELPKDVLNQIGLENIETCLARHCPNSFCVSLTTTSLKKISYSGDTMPCAQFVKLGADSDLLIHEATMEDALENEAKYKMHSTVTQAVDIGRQMNAKSIILTHFSQRYARVPILSAEIEHSKNVGVAFDNMEVSLDDIPLLPHLYPALKLMFAEHFENLENKAIRRAIKRDWNRSPIDLHKPELPPQEKTMKPSLTKHLVENI